MKQLIKKSGNQPVVTTNIISNEFGRRHDNVLQSIRSLIESGHLGALDFKETSYIDKSSREKPCYELTERGFLIAMPFIGGEKARDGQVRLVDSFIQFREKAAREAKVQIERNIARMEYKPMTDAVKESKIQEGKEPAHYHFSNEADLINRIVLGVSSAKFRKDNDIGKTDPIRDYLSHQQIHAITELQRANTVFISMGWDFEQRKESLKGLFNKNHKQPLLEEMHRLAA
ncbi:Rha family transcriptional regulator [Providencia rettgeri]|uniref:Rha family transcriptional regulator n=1 Tax=Providencia rettgeri TaxID=587 RepID=UPI001655B922|nr:MULTISPECIES: Rha family transcriptional regulator [Providencia]MBC8655037.1 Rha family transcriptional regulator [Providencia vermicola]MBG5894953.1 Rha family transcriptional regulator [Providencia rettgeri]MBN6350405.1 Rha family transcriptional regulator [Providencia rettgeri]